MSQSKKSNISPHFLLGKQENEPETVGDFISPTYKNNTRLFYNHLSPLHKKYISLGEDYFTKDVQNHIHIFGSSEASNEMDMFLINTKILS